MEWLIRLIRWLFLLELPKKCVLALAFIIVPLRHPFDMARRVATVDVLSGGRFVLGIGVGWLEDEFRLYRFRSRNALSEHANISK